MMFHEGIQQVDPLRQLQNQVQTSSMAVSSLLKETRTMLVNYLVRTSLNFLRKQKVSHSVGQSLKTSYSFS